MRFRSTLAAAALLVSCKGQQKSSAPMNCFFDKNVNNQYLCFNKQTVEIMPGYTPEQVIRKLIDREIYAWKASSIVADAQENTLFAYEASKRAKEEYGKSPRLADIDGVTLSKTSDGNDTWVLMFHSRQGVTQSLWMGQCQKFTNAESCPVRSLSDY